MAEHGEQARRRRRVRHPATRTDTELVASTSDPEDRITAPPVEPGDADPGPSERGLRGLIGGGSSQVKPNIAMRARDAARPRPADLARAETELAVIRRHWTPRD
jgi:hypothetical protein